MDDGTPVVIQRKKKLTYDDVIEFHHTDSEGKKPDLRKVHTSASIYRKF